MNSNSIKPHSGRPAGIAWCAAVSAGLALVANLQAQTDNFNSGSDAVWQKSTTAGGVGQCGAVDGVVDGSGDAMGANPSA